jgi:two-component sensor histidine kinase
MNRLLISPLTDENDKVVAFVGIQSVLDPEGTGQKPRDEPDMMLQELQHRVKNHLAMVVGLIRMQAAKEVTPDSLDALSHRIESLAMLYDELSPVGVTEIHSQTVPAGAYLSRIASALTALDGRGGIRVNVACDDIELPVERGARCGLILTELLTNALEHAFEERERGLVEVRFRKMAQSAYRLTVEDDGIGMPEGSQWPDKSLSVEEQAERSAKATGAMSTRSLGGSIVSALTKSLGGEISVHGTDFGTTVTVDFPKDQ